MPKVSVVSSVYNRAGLLRNALRSYMQQDLWGVDWEYVLVYDGSTDELGYRAQENPVNVHDLHATMLALLGVDHHRLNTKFQGLDVRLTGVAGNVVKGIMA